MDFKVAAKCVFEQDTGLIVDEADNKLPVKAVIVCKMTSFVIMEEGDLDYLAGDKMETVYQMEDQYIGFLEKQI